MTESMLKKKDWSKQARRALNPTEIVTRLAALQGWQLSGDGADAAIEKTYRFADYYETISFVNALAFIGPLQPLRGALQHARRARHLRNRFRVRRAGRRAAGMTPEARLG